MIVEIVCMGLLGCDLNVKFFFVFFVLEFVWFCNCDDFFGLICICLSLGEDEFFFWCGFWVGVDLLVYFWEFGLCIFVDFWVGRIIECFCMNMNVLIVVRVWKFCKVMVSGLRKSVLIVVVVFRRWFWYLFFSLRVLVGMLLIMLIRSLVRVILKVWRNLRRVFWIVWRLRLRWRVRIRVLIE